MSAIELINSLRKEFENPTEWKRRQAFLQMNFNQLPFDRLVCLSHCYVNSSLHGAVYPERVMDEVEQYSRTLDVFVAANGGSGDGASSSSGTAHNAAQKRAASNADAGSEPPWKRLARESSNSKVADHPHHTTNSAGSSSSIISNRPRPLDLDSQLEQSSNLLSDGVDLSGANLTDFYLREIESDDAANPPNPAATNPANVLKCSADFCRRTLEYKFEENAKLSSVRCTVLLDGRPVSALTAESKLAAKAGAGAGLLTALRQRCWTLLVRSDRAFISAQAEAGIARPKEAAAPGETTDEAKIGSDNVGHRLLKGMGWSGVGGIGKRLDGRAEPVANDVRIVSRAGLGADASTVGAAANPSSNFQSGVNRVLRDFQRDEADRDDLFFAADFTNEERRYVHAQCLRLGLASRSYSGDDGARCLVVSRKRTAAELVEFVRRNGGSTVRYRLVPPGQRGVGDGDDEAAGSGATGSEATGSGATGSGAAGSKATGSGEAATDSGNN